MHEPHALRFDVEVNVTSSAGGYVRAALDLMNLSRFGVSEGGVYGGNVLDCFGQRTVFSLQSRFNGHRANIGGCVVVQWVVHKFVLFIFFPIKVLANRVPQVRGCPD